MQGAGDAEADPPPNTEIDIEETVELDEGLDLDGWDVRGKDRGQNGPFSGVLGACSTRMKSRSTALIIGTAYHVVALAVYGRSSPDIHLTSAVLSTMRIRHMPLRCTSAKM